MNDADKQQIIEGAAAKVNEILGGENPYATSGTPRLDNLALHQTAVTEEELVEIIAQVRKAIKTDEGRKAVFDAAVGLVETLLKKGLCFLKI